MIQSGLHACILDNTWPIPASAKPSGFYLLPFVQWDPGRPALFSPGWWFCWSSPHDCSGGREVRHAVHYAHQRPSAGLSGVHTSLHAHGPEHHCPTVDAMKDLCGKW